MVRDRARRWTMRSVSVGILLCMFDAGCQPELISKCFQASLDSEAIKCDSDPNVGSSIDDCSKMPIAPEHMPIEGSACDQMIAIDTVMTCSSFLDDAGNIVWEGKQLFAGAKGVLGTYCRYEWVGPKNAINDKWLLLPKTDDCTFITPQSWPDSFDQWAHNEFVQSVSGDRAPAMKADGLRARVIVFDTSPDLNDAPDIEPGLTSNHGETLANMIEDLACGDNGAMCRIQVKTQLVMPWFVDGGIPNYRTGGGNVGRLSDVAEGMWKEIELFRQELQNAADDLVADPANKTRALAMPTRLVLNESFAFGGDRCDDKPQDGPEDVRAFYETLQAAACLGAAHIAAAGNHSGGESSSGLLCPARWDHAIAPKIELCESLFGTNEFNAIQLRFLAVTEAKYGTKHEIISSNSVLNSDALLSVGAVDFSGLPIVMTRSQACPEAVALGIGGVGWKNSGTPQEYLFGTSVSAAVVSARIAAQWSQDGQQSLSASGMFEATVANAYKLNFTTGGACEHLGSDICVNTPWIGAASVDPVFLGSVQNGSLPELASNELFQRDDTAKALSSFAFQEYENDHAPLCMTNIPQCVTENAAAAAVRLSTTASIIWPQPTDPICLRCGITFRGNGWVDLWLDPNGRFSLNGTTRTVIKSAALMIGNAQGRVEMTIPVDPSVIALPSVTRIAVPITALSGKRAWLSAYDNQGNSFSQQIFVIP